MCCFYSKSSTCICPSHPAYAGLKGERDDIICMTQGISTIVKPLCVTGEKPVCKSSSQGCCFSSRCAYPCDEDVVPGLGCCFLRCFKCGPCACSPGCCVTKDALKGSAFGGYAVEVAEANKSAEYILCSCCGSLCSVYNPATYKDAFGQEVKSVCCCFEVDAKMSMLPKAMDGYEIMVENMGTALCVKPSTCCKGVGRFFFVMSKCAFPCDNEVPFGCVICGMKLFGVSPEGFKEPAFKEYMFKPIKQAVDTSTSSTGSPVSQENMAR